MDKKEYAKLLLDPRWRAKRSEILERDKRTCTRCKSRNDLQVHHLVYEDDFPWESKNEDLITLCKSCHKLWHKLNKPEHRSYAGGFTTNYKDIDLSSKTEIITSKKLRDAIMIDKNNTSNELHYIDDSINSFIDDILSLQEIQENGKIKVTTNIKGVIFANIQIVIDYTTKDPYTKFKVIKEVKTKKPRQ